MMPAQNGVWVRCRAPLASQATDECRSCCLENGLQNVAVLLAPYRSGARDSLAARPARYTDLMAGSSSVRAVAWCVAWVANVCFSLPVMAAVYYVAPTGDDAGSGSFEAPFRSVAQGLASATSPGDTVLVRAGLYQPAAGLAMGFSGVPGQPITLAAYPGERPIRDGSLMPDSTPVLFLIARHLEVRGFEIRSGKTQGISAFGPGSVLNHVVIEDNVIHDCWLSGIYIGWSNPVDPPSDFLVRGNVIYRNALANEVPPRTSWPFGVGAGISTRVALKDNQVFENFGEGIGFFLSSHCTVVDNVVRDSYSVNVYLDNATDCLVERNFAHSTGLVEFFRFDEPAAGVVIANESYPFANPSARNTIINNVLVDTGRGFRYGNYQEGGGLIDTLVANNTLVGASGALLEIDADTHAGSRITNNLFVQASSDPLTWVDEPLGGVSFDHNQWFGGSLETAVISPTDVFAQPLFVDSASGALGYRLLAASPGLDAGSSVIGVDVDYRGYPRAGDPELGAFQSSVLFVDGFEVGNTSDWSTASP